MYFMSQRAKQRRTKYPVREGLKLGGFQGFEVSVDQHCRLSMNKNGKAKKKDIPPIVQNVLDSQIAAKARMQAAG